MDMATEMGIIVSGDSALVGDLGQPTVVGRRLPYLNYPPHSENGLFSVPAPSLILAVFDGVFYLV